MFDLGWTEFIVVAVVAILVVGPKELPGMLRTIGKTIGSMRRMAGDFQRQMNDALKEADLDGIKTGIESVNSINPVSQLKNSLNPVKQAAEDVQRDINKGLLNAGEGAKPETSKPTAPDAVAAEKPKAAPKPKTAAKTAAKPKAAAKTKAAAKPAAPKTAAKKATPAKTTTAKTTTAKTEASKTAASKTAAAKTSAAKTATTAKAGAAKTTAARKPAAKKTTAKTAGASKKETDA